MKLEDLTGRQFWRLTVIERADAANAKHTYWKCVCDCGKTTIVASQKLKNGSTKSCGCYSADRATKHGMQGTRLYKIWQNMKSRCHNPNATAYERYGGRGITVCDEWKHEFRAFLDWALVNGYQDGLSLDRIDNDKGYSPENCRWITQKQQSNNTASNHIVEYNGETHTVSEWAEILGIHKHTLSNRLMRGWPIERALGEKVAAKR